MRYTPHTPADPAAVRDTAARRLLVALDLALLACDPGRRDYSAVEAARLCAALKPLRDHAREVLGR